MKMYFKWVIFFGLLVPSLNALFTDEDAVIFKSINKHHTFNVPLAKDPIASWMEIQKGTYPNVTEINSQVKIGEQLSILIYMHDKSNKYDVQVKDCYAYDDKDYQRSQYHLLLTSNLNSKSKIIHKWNKIKNLDSSITLLHTQFISFKFPDKQLVYLTCNIEIIKIFIAELTYNENEVGIFTLKE